MTTSSHLHSFRAGAGLTTYHIAALAGLDTTKMNFAQGMSPQWFAQRVGLGVHAASFGAVLMGALAIPIRQLLGEQRGAMHMFSAQILMQGLTRPAFLRPTLSTQMLGYISWRYRAL